MELKNIISNTNYKNNMELTKVEKTRQTKLRNRQIKLLKKETKADASKMVELNKLKLEKSTSFKQEKSITKTKQTTRYNKVKREKLLNDLLTKQIKKVESFNTKTYHIKGTVNIIKTYTLDKKKKDGTRFIKNIDHIVKIPEARVIKATSLDKAKAIFHDLVYDAHDNVEGDEINYEVLSQVKSIDYHGFIDETEMKSSKPNNMMMKSGSPIDYNFTTEEKKYLKYTDTCVEDNLIGVYGEIIKKFTKNKLVEIASDFYDDKITNW